MLVLRPHPTPALHSQSGKLSAGGGGKTLAIRYDRNMKATELVYASFSHGWQTFVKRPWFLIGSVVVVFGVSAVSGGIAQSAGDGGVAATSFIFNAVDFFVVQIFVSMGIIAWSLKANSQIESTKISDLWAPHAYWRYLGTSILITIIELIGFALLVIPGIIASVLLMFAPFLVIDRGLSPFAAVKASFAINKEHFWAVFLLMLAAIAANIIGLILLGVGLLVSIPVTVIAMAYAYRTLSSMPMEA